MSELTLPQAAKLVGTSDQTLRRRVKDGTLPATLRGVGKVAIVRIEDLRDLAARLNYPFDEAEALKLCPE